VDSYQVILSFQNKIVCAAT